MTRRGHPRMGYWLGIDVGSTFTAAAICRVEGGRRALPEVVPLGSRGTAVSSVLYLGAEGQVVVGEAAERRAVTNPNQVVREFKRRIGDEVPMVIGGVPHRAPEIAAIVVGWVVSRVAQREGGPAAGIVITHPASWGTYKVQTMADALRALDLPEITFRTEPEAAAASYACQERVGTGSTIAVYDLGGGTFDAAVVRKTGTMTFSVLGLPQGLDHLGGADFDDAVFGHVVAAVPALSELDPSDPTTLAATAALRRECTAAKEALSADTEVTIPVLAPGVQSQVRLVRAEFEDMIRPQLTQTVQAMRRALQSAQVDPQDLDTVLLVGGSSRVPLVAQLVSAELGRPVAVDADPKAAIALGAAVCALPVDTAQPADSDTASVDVTSDAPVPAAVGATSVAGLAGFDLPEPDPVQAPQRPALTAIPLDVEAALHQWRRARPQRVKRLAAAGLFVLVLAGGAVAVPFLTSRSSPTPPAPATPVTTTPVPRTASPAANGGNGSDTSPHSGNPSGLVHPTLATAPNNATGGATTGAAVVPAPQPTWAPNDSGTTSGSTPPSAQFVPPITTTAPPSTTKAAPATTTAPPTTTPSPRRHRAGT